MKTTEQNMTEQNTVERIEIPSHDSPIERLVPPKHTSRALVVAAVVMALAVGAVGGGVASKYMGASGPTGAIRTGESHLPTTTSPALDEHVVTLRAGQMQNIGIETVD